MLVQVDAVMASIRRPCHNLADFRHAVAEIAVFERDEGVEAARLVLLAAQPVEVVDAVFDTSDSGRRGSWRWSIPSRCAAACTSNHSTVEPLSGQIRARSSSSKISAPPPGIASIPALRSRRNPSTIVSPALVDHVESSMAVKRLDGRFGQDRLHAADHLDVIVQIVLGMHASDDMHWLPCPKKVGRSVRPLPGSNPTPDFLRRR
ncbi:MAG: hypothetical protein ACLVJK_02975 [Alistipes putredinis]